MEDSPECLVELAGLDIPKEPRRKRFLREVRKARQNLWDENIFYGWVDRRTIYWRNRPRVKKFLDSVLWVNIPFQLLTTMTIVALIIGKRQANQVIDSKNLVDSFNAMANPLMGTSLLSIIVVGSTVLNIMDNTTDSTPDGQKKSNLFRCMIFGLSMLIALINFCSVGYARFLL